MGQLPSILKDLKNPDAPLHIGSILSDEPLCKNFSAAETDLVGWVSSRGWHPNEKFCPECAALYEQGWAWKSPSARQRTEES